MVCPGDIFIDTKKHVHSALLDILNVLVMFCCSVLFLNSLFINPLLKTATISCILITPFQLYHNLLTILQRFDA